MNAFYMISRSSSIAGIRRWSRTTTRYFQKSLICSLSQVHSTSLSLPTIIQSSPQINSNSTSLATRFMLSHYNYSSNSFTSRFSSSTPSDDSQDKNSEVDTDTLNDDERTWKLLYHRSPNRLTMPRGLFGVSTFFQIYWTWYVVDFTPAINKSAQAKYTAGQISQETLELLLIDDLMGYVGLGMSSLIFAGVYMYTRQLVSAIWSSPETEDIAISTLKLPFLTQPKILDKTVYNPESNEFDGVEDITFTDSELKSANALLFAPGELTLSEEQRKNDAIVKFDGNFSRLRGHIAIKSDDTYTAAEDDETANSGPLDFLYSQKYLLDINNSSEVMTNASPALMHSLVLKDYHFPQRSKRGGKYNHKSGASAIREKRASSRNIPTSGKGSIKSKGGFGKKKKGLR